MTTRKLTYLAVPYSHQDALVRLWRFEMANTAAARLMGAGEFVFSPISHTHPIALAGNLPLGWDYWEAYDRAILQSCGKIVVLMLPGWEISKGIEGECNIARELGIPVEFMSLQDIAS